MMRYLPLFITLFLLHACAAKRNIVYETETLKVEQIAKNTFIHTSFLPTESYGKVACNGMLVVENREAIVIDTPIDATASEELLEWIDDNLYGEVIGVVVTHFHVDCLGGLTTFHANKIPSYAHQKTIELATAQEVVAPQNGFTESLVLEVGGLPLINRYFGEGHTVDNIVSYFPEDEVLFGGCLIKSLGFGKGNLADAKVENWSNTVQKVKSAFPDVRIVVPGHGRHGNQELLNYTIEMFE